MLTVDASGITIIIQRAQLNTTPIRGVNRDWLKYDKNRGKWPFLAAANTIRAAVKADPFEAPNVEHATPSGTIQAKEPKTRSPKVIATAL